MNLHGIVAGAIAAVNPFVPGVLSTSTGYTTSADGTRTPTYTRTNVSVQLQALSAQELTQVENLNVQSVLRGAYIAGDVEGIVRPLGKGGDLLTIGSDTWLVIQVLEHWPDWSKVALALQVSA